jgi:TIR domain/Leucine Rich repeats (2 copies)
MLGQFLGPILAENRVSKAKEAGTLALDLSQLEFNRLPRKSAQLTSLVTLNLAGCVELTDLYSLASLTSLQTLNLSGCQQLSDLSPLATLTSLQTLNLSSCWKVNDLSPLASLTSLQTLTLSGCWEVSDLSPLATLTSLQTLDLSYCSQLSDPSPLAGLASLQTLKLQYCKGFREFAPLEPLLSTLQHLRLYDCNFFDLPYEFCPCRDEGDVLGKVRFYYRERRDASAETIKSVSPETPPRIFISYAWGDTSPIASREDRKRQEVIERLCQALEKGPWEVVLDKSVLRYGDLISSFMKTLGRADTIIVVLSAKYLRSPYCVTELYDIYEQSLREKEGFLRRIIPIVLDDAKIAAWRDRVIYTKHWETEFKAMEDDLIHLGGEDMKLYKAMRRWHNEVGDMLSYINDVLHPHGFEAIVKDNFAALRHMLEERARA